MLKDDYNRYMADYTRPAAKLELKYKAPKHLVRQTKFIKIWPFSATSLQIIRQDGQLLSVNLNYFNNLSKWPQS